MFIYLLPHKAEKDNTALVCCCCFQQRPMRDSWEFDFNKEKIRKNHELTKVCDVMDISEVTATLDLTIIARCGAVGTTACYCPPRQKVVYKWHLKISYWRKCLENISSTLSSVFHQMAKIPSQIYSTTRQLCVKKSLSISKSEKISLFMADF